MGLTVKYQTRVVIAIEGQLTTDNRDDLSELIMDEIQNGVRRFVLDFNECGFIDSSGLAGLVSNHRKVRDHGCKMKFRGLSVDLMELFRLSKLDTLFDIEA